MLDPFTLAEALKLEQQLLAAREAREALWRERTTPGGASDGSGRVRRRLARALLALADRLDPRAVVSVPHVAARPSLNGTLHRA